MFKTTCILITVLALTTFSAQPAAAQSDAQGSRFKRTKRTSPTFPADPFEAEDSDEADGNPSDSEIAPRPFSRPASNPPTAVKVRGGASESAGRLRSPVVRDDGLSDDSLDSEPAQPRKSGLPKTKEQDGPRQTRHTTINRALAAQPATRKPATYLAQFEGGENVEPGPQPSGDGTPAEVTVQSLQEQIAELTARINALTAGQGRAPMPQNEPSTVQGSVFGPGVAAPPSSATSPPGPGEPSTVQGSVFGSDVTARSAWANDGLTFISADGTYKTHLGGLVQLDLITFANDMPGITSVPGGAGTQTATNFRRLRLRADGTMYNFIDWVAEVDFSGFVQNLDQRDAAAPNLGLRSFPTGTGVEAGNTINVIQPTTIFMTFKDIPVLGNIRVGNQQDWFSFEHIESARFLDFMERSPMMDVFSGPNNNGYTPGVSAFNNTPDKMAGAQIGVYKNNAYDSGYTFNVGDAWTYGGRLIWTPYYDEESKGRYMVHTGFGTEYRTFNDNVSATTGFDNVRLRSRGDLRNVSATLDPNYADTGNFYATSQLMIDPELVVQVGPFLFQSEYTSTWFYGAKPAKNLPTSLGSVFFQGGYLETLVFLTGENRDYNRQQGVFNRVVPKNKFNRSAGTWGAWQVGVRYDWLDMNSGQFVSGGNASDVTFGLNWFLNANARFQFNYVLSWVNNAPPVTFPGTLGALNGSRFVGDGTINSVGFRMDFNW